MYAPRFLKLRPFLSSITVKHHDQWIRLYSKGAPKTKKVIFLGSGNLCGRFIMERKWSGPVTGGGA